MARFHKAVLAQLDTVFPGDRGTFRQAPREPLKNAILVVGRNFNANLLQVRALFYLSLRSSSARKSQEKRKRSVSPRPEDRDAGQDAGQDAQNGACDGLE